MAKPTYAVRIARPRGIDADESRGARTVDRTFVELVRASNRREAMMLARARYPGHEVFGGARRVDDGHRTPAARR